ncbi:MAG TPA: hypothetical protein VFQ53_11340 [Kofleriaceae bacterium]|nr:hypothetical protein [Kofleriaceae bacterium]
MTPRRREALWGTCITLAALAVFPVIWLCDLPNATRYARLMRMRSSEDIELALVRDIRCWSRAIPSIASGYEDHVLVELVLHDGRRVVLDSWHAGDRAKLSEIRTLPPERSLGRAAGSLPWMLWIAFALPCWIALWIVLT